MITTRPRQVPFPAQVLAHHVVDFDVAVGEGNGVRRRCYGNHESVGCGDSGRYHEVERVDAELFTLCACACAGTILYKSITIYYNDENCLLHIFHT